MIAAVWAALSCSAEARSVCGPRARFLNHLSETYGEQPAAIGVTAVGEVVEVLISTRRSWTIIVTYPNGRTCLVSAGEAWERLQSLKPERKPRS